MTVKYALHGKDPEPGEGASGVARLDPAAAGGCGGGLATKHQLGRTESLRPEPRAGAPFRARLRGGDGRYFQTGGKMKLIDERFLAHRLRSTSLAGIAGGALAALLWFYRYVFDHRWNW